MSSMPRSPRTGQEKKARVTPGLIDFFIANMLNNLRQKGWLLPAALACTLATPWSARWLELSGGLVVRQGNRRQTRPPQFRLSRHHRC
jgi:hypothetical protein